MFLKTNDRIIVTDYCTLDIICYAKCSQLSISGPISVAIMSLLGILSDRFLCKIIIFCNYIFTVERGQREEYTFYTSE